MLMSIFNKKIIRIPLQYLKKSIHCARNHKGKGKWKQDSDYFGVFKINLFINLKL